jgi:GNAT superfamily N-acetyltransferase
LEILPCSAEIWPFFRVHHYLDGNINKTAQCWVAVWEGTIVGFSAALPFPNGNFKNAWRGHRTVILPEYQGLGFGTRLSDAIGEIFLARGCRFFSKTAHPRLGEYRNSSPRWRGTSKNGKGRKDYITNRAVKEKNHKDKHIKRVCFSHEYVGKTLDKSNT